MWLQVQGRVASGDDALDIGIRDIQLWQSGSDTYALTSSGRAGGLVNYRVDSAGLTLMDSRAFHPGIDRHAAPNLVVHALDDFLQAGVTVMNGEIGGYRLRGDGMIGGRRWVPLEDAAELGRAGVAEGFAAPALLQDAPVSGVPDGGWSAATVGFAPVQGGFLALGGLEGALYSYHGAPSGAVTLDARFGAQQGLWVHAPTALEVIDAHGAQWAVVGAAGSHSLTVLRVDPVQGLQVTDHLMDNGATRFADVQAVATAVAGDHAFVVAGGGDHGLTLFALLPDGRLVWLQTIADGPETGLRNVTALEAAVVGDQLVVMAGSQADAGLTSFTLPLSRLGDVIEGDADSTATLRGGARDDILVAHAPGTRLEGGAGNDILVAPPGETVMTGGAGADTFVLHALTTEARITDFQRGADRLDLSAWPMLRSPDQLSVAATSSGASVSYREATLQITAADGAPLGRDDLFGHAVQTPDRIQVLSDSAVLPVDPPAPPPEAPAPPPPSPPPPPPPPPDDQPPPDPAPPSQPAPPQPDPPPEDGTLNGTVLSRSGAGVGGIAVRARDPENGAVLAETTTAASGAFALSHDGALALEFAHSFNGTATRPVTAMDALDVLRIAVGLAPSFAADGLRMADFVAADLNRDGRVTAVDALEALRVAVGLTPVPDPVFLPLSEAQAAATRDGPNGTAPDSQAAERLDFMAVLPGDLDASYGWLV